jgi:hypothetical protein
MKQLNGLFCMVALVALSTVHAQSINVTSTGVGVGTAAPTGKLDVSSAGGLVVAGANLDPSFGYALSPLQNSGKVLVGWNRTAGGGEIDFISNRQGGAQGGFAFYDFTNLGVLTHLITLTGDGKLGVGTVNPSAKLSINQVNSSGWSGNLDAFEVVSPDIAYRLTLKSYVVSAGNTGYNFSPNGVTGLVISTPGNVGVGTLNPTHKLTVNGQAKSKGFIQDTSNWSDYVFEPGYRLAPLAEVEAHIKEKKHLPGIPAEAELVKNGLDLGEMSKAQMAQIEQLMLHVIALNKQVQAQAKRIAELEATRSAK